MSLADLIPDVQECTWVSRWRSGTASVVGSIPGPGVIKHLGQLSLPSLRGM